MSALQDDQAFLELVERMQPGAILRRAWHLTGGVSAQITALEVELPTGQPVKLIVRRHGEVDRAANPHIARDEYRLLEVVRHYGVLAPKPAFLDESCSLFPTPLLVVGYIEGDTDSGPDNVSDYISSLTAELTKIHSIKDSPLLSFLPRLGRGFGNRPAELDESMNEGSIRDALESAWPVRQTNPDVLLHGDYWPGNVLWKDGELAAVIDWEDARVGDPLADLANSRLEILFEFGRQSMEAFTQRYHSLTDIDLANLPYWDLTAALRPCGKLQSWGLDPKVESRMRKRHKRFVKRAIDRLDSR